MLCEYKEGSDDQASDLVYLYGWLGLTIYTASHTRNTHTRIFPTGLNNFFLTARVEKKDKLKGLSINLTSFVPMLNFVIIRGVVSFILVTGV